jgi:Tfp pilus assembly protein PilF
MIRRVPMSTHSLLLIGLLATTTTLAQNPDAASIKVHEGVELHDKGEYKKAIKKYDEALELDKDNLAAMAEKAMTMNALGQLEESAALCQEIIEKHDGAKEAPMVYVTYGNCMDQLKRPEASLRVYEKGISVLPDMYMLHFNKGITLMGMDSSDQALRCFERSARLNPFHPGTQNAISRILYTKKRSIPATLAFCRFFALEQETERAKQNLGFLMQDMRSGSTKTAGGGTSIEVDASMVRDSTDTVHVENDFRDEEVAWTVSKGVDLTAVLMQALQAVEKSSSTRESVAITGPDTPGGLTMRFEELAGLLKTGRPKNHGFHWDYYAAWFIALKEAGHAETLAHLALVNSGEKDIRKWLEGNGAKVNSYFDWEKDYTAQYLKAKPGQ